MTCHRRGHLGRPQADRAEVGHDRQNDKFRLAAAICRDNTEIRALYQA